MMVTRSGMMVETEKRFSRSCRLTSPAAIRPLGTTGKVPV